jgi:hypothetical protein
MNKQSLIMNFISFIVALTFLSCSGDSDTDTSSSNNKPEEKLQLTTAVPPGGNSWVINNLEANGDLIFDDGIHNWTSTHPVIRTYFKTQNKGELHVGLKIKVASGKSIIKVTVGNTSKEVEVNNTNYQVVEVGKFQVAEAGYNYIDLQGVSKSGTYMADVTEVVIGGPAAAGNVTTVKDDFYWGRRGPSVHLSYKTPENKDIQWFYNEITVPEGEDVLGSYYMANGFGEGYFGIQVNSETERRVLFSVWSPYDTQNPDDIPDDYKIKLLKKGANVNTGEFGNEGSGGQSYLVYNWKPSTTYKFLLKGEPSENNSTDYTAYFYAPEEGKWQLIASFRRPYTNTYLTGIYSFLENFITHTGYIPRMANYSNQWVVDTNNTWHELTKATFTADATARKGNRLDYAGGANGNIFFMKNCGFFSDNTTIDTEHTRTANGAQPDIDLQALENL